MQTQPNLGLNSSQDVVAGVTNSGMTASDFLTLFPEFSDATRFPMPTVSLWLQMGRSFVDETRWGASTNLGIGLFVAHQLTVGAQTAAAVQGGATPGVGVISSKSVGPLSKSYDTSIGGYDDAGFWNTTSYGRQYWAFVSLFGAGGTQL
ncbi:DUF4054 domain-containing protein [Asaia bogorensis]|uniref:Bacteriophage protein n=2 Tax=Asaia TaxID=91914 RepID=A0A060QKP9_9PROT|nr:DUF4054 domain-containing protein [Asaia bogorensis]CDG39627.1 putative bacteriophage protein [Asaia bogorensis]